MTQQQPLWYQRRHWLEPNQTPTMPYVVRMPNGDIGQARSPFYLMDLIFTECYSDCEEMETWWYIGMERLRDIAVTFAMQRKRVSVYSAMGPFYDSAVSRYPDEIMEEATLDFENADDPIVFDGWDAWTMVASLIRAGYIRIWEKIPTFSEKSKVQSCDACVFKQEQDGEAYCTAWESYDAPTEFNRICWWVTNEKPLDNYREVQPDQIMTDLTFKRRWKPVHQRTEEYVGYRHQNLQRAKMNEKGEVDNS